MTNFTASYRDYTKEDTVTRREIRIKAENLRDAFIIFINNHPHALLYYIQEV